jgi:hypothetical protein
MNGAPRSYFVESRRIIGIVVVSSSVGLLVGAAWWTASTPEALTALKLRLQHMVMPSGCTEGQLLTYDRDGRLACRPPSQALKLAGCTAGDFVMAGPEGELRCERPSSTLFGAPREVLPRCAAGASIVAEGANRWRCVEGSLPRCAEGEFLVAGAQGAWRCTPPRHRW